MSDAQNKERREALFEETVRFSAAVLEKLRTANIEKKLIAMSSIGFSTPHDAVTTTDESVIRAFRLVIEKSLKEQGLKPFHTNEKKGWVKMNLGQFWYNDVGNPLSSQPSIGAVRIICYGDKKKLRGALNISEDKLRQYCREALDDHLKFVADTTPAPKPPTPGP